jgi:hypothetical protein
LTGKGNAAGEALAEVLSNAGAFVPGPDGAVSAEESLKVLRGGLKAYLDARLEADLLPLLQSEPGIPPEARLYMDEVLLPTLRTVTDTVMDAVLAWQAADADTQRALREMCSALVMRLFGRSLVAAADILQAHALGKIQGELRQLAAAAGDPGGIAPKLAEITGLDRGMVSDLVSETLEVCAETFGPMEAARRSQVRDLLYQMIDTMPPDADASTLEALKATALVGNAEAAVELAQLLGEEIAGNIGRFVQALLTRVAWTGLDLLQDMINDVQASVVRWMRQIEELSEQVTIRLAELLREIGKLQERLDDAVDGVLGHAATVLGGFSEQPGDRDKISEMVASAATSRALAALAAVPGYTILPNGTRRLIRRAVRTHVERAIGEPILDPVVDVLLATSAETASFLDDLQNIEPGDNLEAAVADLALDRIEAALRAALGARASFRIRFAAPVLGEVDLGWVDVPIDDLVGVVRAAIRATAAFAEAVASTAEAFAAMVRAEAAIEAAEDERQAASALKEEAGGWIAETRDGSLDLAISKPSPGEATSGPVTVELHVHGASAALLRNDGLAHRRLFVWVNETEVDLGTAVTRVEAPIGTPFQPAGSPAAPRRSPSPGTDPAGAASPTPAARSVRRRAVRFDTNAGSRSTCSAG